MPSKTEYIAYIKIKNPKFKVDKQMKKSELEKIAIKLGWVKDKSLTILFDG